MELSFYSLHHIVFHTFPKNFTLVKSCFPSPVKTFHCLCCVLKIVYISNVIILQINATKIMTFAKFQSISLQINEGEQKESIHTHV